MKYRIGKKRKRALLNEKGQEVALFNKGYEAEAQQVCDLLNRDNLLTKEDPTMIRNNNKIPEKNILIINIKNRNKRKISKAVLFNCKNDFNDDRLSPDIEIKGDNGISHLDIKKAIVGNKYRITNLTFDVSHTKQIKKSWVIGHELNRIGVAIFEWFPKKYTNKTLPTRAKDTNPCITLDENTFIEFPMSPGVEVSITFEIEEIYR